MTPEPRIDESIGQTPGAIRKGLLLICGSLLLELLACAAALSDRLHTGGAIIALLLHAVVSAFAARGLHLMVPPSQQSPRQAGLMFLFAITFCMPLFGALGMLGGLLAEL